MSNSNRTSVVTVFLRHSKGRILLLKRSEKVRTYTGLWGAVSGYLENRDPLQQAYVEVREETGQSRDRVTLAKKGSTLTVSDSENDLGWRIYPFRFHYTGAREEIKLSEEHVQYCWDQPAAMEALPTVPALQETWERVAP